MTRSIPSNASHYEVLGVERDASDVYIRRAYHRHALELHPDRAGSQHTAAFQRLSRAYEVLSDPVKRRAYDRNGDDGVDMVEGSFAGPLAQSIGIKTIAAVSGAVTVIALVCAIIVMATVAAKVDGAMDWQWPAVLWALWLWDAVAVGIVCFCFVTACATKGSQSDLAAEPARGIRADHWIALLVVACYIATTVMLAVALQQKTFGAVLVVAPAVFAELVVAVLCFVRRIDRSKIKELLHINTGVDPPDWVVNCVVADDVGFIFHRLLTWILLALRTDGYFGTVHYFIAFIPSLIFMVLGLVSNWAVTSLSETNGTVTFWQRVASTIIALVRHGVITSGAVLVSIKAQSNGSEPDQLVICLIPWFVVSVCLLLLACFMTVVLGDSVRDDVIELDAMEQQHQQPPHPRSDRGNPQDNGGELSPTGFAAIHVA